MYKYLKMSNFPRLNFKINIKMNTVITHNEIESVIKRNSQHTKFNNWLHSWILPNILKELTPTYLRLFKKKKRKGRNAYKVVLKNKVCEKGNNRLIPLMSINAKSSTKY